MTASLPPGLRAVLFDLDDTLYEEHRFVDGGFRAVGAFLATQLDADPDAVVARLWELHDNEGRGRLFDTLLAGLGVGDAPDLVAGCLQAYRTHPAVLAPFDGAIEAIDAIRAAGLRTGVISDGKGSVQRRKVEAVEGLLPRLDLVILTDDLGPGLAKPSPVAFLVASRFLGLEPGQAAYVGNDPSKDFAGARAAGWATIRMGRLPAYGGDHRIGIDPAADADLAIDDFPTLAALVLAAATAPGPGPGTEVNP